MGLPPPPPPTHTHTHTHTHAHSQYIAPGATGPRAPRLVRTWGGLFKIWKLTDFVGKSELDWGWVERRLVIYSLRLSPLWTLVASHRRLFLQGKSDTLRTQEGVPGPPGAGEGEALRVTGWGGWRATFSSRGTCRAGLVYLGGSRVITGRVLKRTEVGQPGGWARPEPGGVSGSPPGSQGGVLATDWTGSPLACGELACPTGWPQTSGPGAAEALSRVLPSRRSTSTPAQSYAWDAHLSEWSPLNPGCADPESGRHGRGREGCLPLGSSADSRGNANLTRRGP